MTNPLNLKRVSVATSSIIVLGSALFFFATRANAQSGYRRPPGNGTVHFQSKLGSFKFLHIGNHLVTGTLTFTFQGSVLVSGCAHVPKVTGKVMLEYQNPAHKKLGYHGSGTMTVQGPFESVEWFGKNMTGVFDGRGKLRLYGEFDKNLNTGTYWTRNPKDVKYWPANGTEDIFVPNFLTPGNVSNSGEKPMSRQTYNQKKKGGK